MTRLTYHNWQSLFLYYIVQVVNSQRGHHAVIALLHHRSGGYCHSRDKRVLVNVPKVGKCVKFSQITYFSEDKSILCFIVRVLQGGDFRNVKFAFVRFVHFFKDLWL